MSSTNQEALRRKIEELQLEHRDLDDAIYHLQAAGTMEQLQLQRLKRRKLKLKDQITQLENQLIPDILA